jgi:hypothetical protein
MSEQKRQEKDGEDKNKTKQATREGRELRESSAQEDLRGSF